MLKLYETRDSDLLLAPKSAIMRAEVAQMVGALDRVDGVALEWMLEHADRHEGRA